MSKNTHNKALISSKIHFNKNHNSIPGNIFLILIFLFSMFHVQESTAQVKIIVEKTPANTPPNAPLYITGNFNNWNPGDEKYRLLPQKDGTYSILLDEEVSPLQFKFTRGNWQTTEGSLGGKSILNRTIPNKKGNTGVHSVEISGWEDLPIIGSYTFVVEKIPDNTPHDASLYIAGNFNDWNPADPSYKLTLQADSSYKITFKAASDTLYYKFTRGSWPSVEGRANGRTVVNRVLVRNSPEPLLIKTKVSAWEDLTSGTTSVYTILLLMAAAQGLFLLFTISGLPNKNKKANALLSILIVVISLSLIGRLAYYESALFNFQPKILLLSDFALFLFCPLFYLYMQNLLTIQLDKDYRKWIHFVPAILHLVLYIPLLLVNNKDFILHIIDQKYSNLFAAIGVAALIFNTFYCFKCHRLLQQYQQQLENTHSYEENLTYLSTFIRFISVILAIWAFSFLIYFVGFLADFNPHWINETTVDFLWIVFSITTYFFGYYAITRPEIFTLLPTEEAMGPEKEKQVSIPDESFVKLKNELSQLMTTQKPYLNPKLSLQELSDLMESNVHTISRLINEGYDKNFYDLINEYRIEEFKERVWAGNLKHHTFLAIALEVGFSSKTTFYRAFKKSTGTTPKEYFSLPGNASSGLEGVR